MTLTYLGGRFLPGRNFPQKSTEKLHKFFLKILCKMPVDKNKKILYNIFRKVEKE